MIKKFIKSLPFCNSFVCLFLNKQTNINKRVLNIIHNSNIRDRIFNRNQSFIRLSVQLTYFLPQPNCVIVLGTVLGYSVLHI